MRRKTNKQQVLEYAKLKGEVTFADVARDLNINSRSISALLQSLTQEGELKVSRCVSGKMRYRAVESVDSERLWRKLLLSGRRVQG